MRRAFEKQWWSGEERTKIKNAERRRTMQEEMKSRGGRRKRG
jgi:hypothetical protein